MLCTVDDIKTLMGRTDGDDDALIGQMAALASNWCAHHCGRYDAASGQSLIEAFTGRVEEFPAGEPHVDLAGYPLAPDAGLVVVVASNRANLDTETPLTAGVDYHYGGLSRLYRLSTGRRSGRAFGWVSGWVRVTYAGGWHPADSADPVPAGFAAVPPLHRSACATLAKHLFENRDHFGQRSFQVGTATIDTVVRDLGVVAIVQQAFDGLRGAAAIGIG